MKKLVTILALTCQISASNGTTLSDSNGATLSEIVSGYQATISEEMVKFSNLKSYEKSIKQMKKTNIGDSNLQEVYEDFMKKREKFLEELADRMLKYSSPSDENDPNIQNLLNMLNLGDKEVEVRFVDSENIIDLCNSDKRKEHYLELLKSEASLKRNFSNGYCFADGMLQQKIISAIEEGCENDIFRNAMVCFLALTEKQRLRQMHFVPARDKESRLEGMSIWIGKNDVIVRSLFKGKNTFSKEGSNIFFIRTALKFILFHEFGHKISGLFNKLNLVDLRNLFEMSDNYKFGINMCDNDDICNILSEFISFSLNEEKLYEDMPRVFAYRNLENIFSCFREKYDPSIEFMINQSTKWVYYMSGKKNIDYVSSNKNEVFDYYENVKAYTTSGKLIAESVECYKNQQLVARQSSYTGYKKELAAWNAWWKNNSNPKAFVSKFLFGSDTPGEIWQILGLAYVKVKGKSVLYINKLSDFALSASLGIPIRLDHFGMGNRREALNTLSEYLTINGPNREVWDALFRVHGSSLEEYESRLH